MKPQLTSIVAAAALLLAGAAQAAETIKIAVLQELSGAGATAGTNAKNGVMLAIKEINEAGGILGRQVEASVADTQSNPGVAKGLASKAVDDGVFAVMGPTFSGSIMVSMAETKRAEIPNFTGGEAASITQQGNPYIFRTSFTQTTAMPKAGALHRQQPEGQDGRGDVRQQRLRQGRRDAFAKAAEAAGMKVVADISTESGQVDWSAPVLKAKQSNADAIFVYTNEEESARALRELRKQGVAKPIVGETTLTGQKVIELAGDAANGAVAHVGLTVDAPNPLMLKFKAKFFQEYKYISDHNGIKGYTGMYLREGRHREGRQGRPRGGGQSAARAEHLGRESARRDHGREHRRQRRPRPRELHRRGEERQAGGQGDPAAAGEEVSHRRDAR